MSNPEERRGFCQVSRPLPVAETCGERQIPVENRTILPQPSNVSRETSRVAPVITAHVSRETFRASRAGTRRGGAPPRKLAGRIPTTVGSLPRTV
jgi:hypothetical protein